MYVRWQFYRVTYEADNRKYIWEDERLFVICQLENMISHVITYDLGSFELDCFTNWSMGYFSRFQRYQFIVKKMSEHELYSKKCKPLDTLLPVINIAVNSL